MLLIERLHEIGKRFQFVIGIGLGAAGEELIDLSGMDSQET